MSDITVTVISESDTETVTIPAPAVIAVSVSQTGPQGASSINNLDDVPQGTSHKWLSATDYALLQEIISVFTTAQ